jgi:prepilin signal peptidase PulO-like enzyme (type II secretory pathway)
VAAVWAVVGAGAGFGIRRLSVWLARIEELEPGFERWQFWGPVATTAVLFAIFGWRFGPAPLLLLKSLWVAVLVYVIFFDLEHRLILDRVMYPSMVLAILASIVTPHPGWLNAIATGIGAGAVFLLLAVGGSLIFRAEVLGIGDVKLAVFMGLVLGFPWTVQALLLGILLAGVLSILLIAIRRKGLRDTIAYGPYLCAGTLIVLLERGAG